MPITAPEGIRTATGALDSLSPYRDKRIQAGLSTQIIIRAQHNDGQFRAVGAIQSLAVTETRPTQTIQEVGTDGIIEIVPNAAATFSLSINRTVFDYQRLMAAFGRGFRHVHIQRFPFDIEVIDYNPYQEMSNASGGLENAITTRFVNCWFQNLNYTFGSDNYLISESATAACETVYDVDAPNPAIGGADEIELQHNNSPSSNVFAQAFEPLPSGIR